jgi:hypothetical protein
MSVVDNQRRFSAVFVFGEFGFSTLVNFYRDQRGIHGIGQCGVGQ